MSGNVVIHTEDAVNTLPNGKKSYVPIKSSNGAAHVAVQTDPQNAFKNFNVLEEVVPIASFNTKSTDFLGIKLTVARNTLDQFEVHVQESDKSDWINLSLANTDFTTPNYPVQRSNITAITSIGIGDSFLDLDVSAYHRVMLKAASSSSSFSEVKATAGEGTDLPRRVKNEWGESFNAASSFNASFGAGTIVGDDATGEITITGAVNARAFNSLLVNIKKGEYYAMSWEIVSVTGTITKDTLTAAGAFDEGTSKAVAATVGRNMIVMRATADVTNAEFRFGIGNLAAEPIASTIVAKNYMVQALGKNIDSLGEYVPAGDAAFFDNAKANNWNPLTNMFEEGGAVTKTNVNKIYAGFIVGDSFATSQQEFARETQLQLGFGALHIYAVSGRTLQTIAANIDSYFETNGTPVNYAEATVEYNVPTNMQLPYWGVIQGGVNDISAATSADNSPISAMMSAFITIHNKFKSFGMKTIAINVAPHAGASGFDLTGFDQLQTVQWNGWLKDYCATNSIGYVDIYKALENPAKATFLSDGVAVTGTHDGLAAASILTDTGATFVPNALIGTVISNTTDGSTGTITANTATTITATLAGGTNDWDVSDAYSIPVFDSQDTDGLHPGLEGSRIIARLLATDVMKLV